MGLEDVDFGSSLFFCGLPTSDGANSHGASRWGGSKEINAFDRED